MSGKATVIETAKNGIPIASATLFISSNKA